MSNKPLCQISSKPKQTVYHADRFQLNDQNARLRCETPCIVNKKTNNVFNKLEFRIGVIIGK